VGTNYELRAIDIQKLEAFAYSIGQTAKLYQELGASPSQAQNYIEFHLIRHSLEERTIFDRASKRGYRDKLGKEYEHPVFDAYKQQLQENIKRNAYCLQAHE
jgi:hypothetical protein